MDYSSGIELIKYQWYVLHDPQKRVFDWAQSEGEGQMIGLSKDNVIYKLREIRESFIYKTKVWFSANYLAYSNKIKIGNKIYKNGIVLVRRGKKPINYVFQYKFDEKDFIERNHEATPYGIRYNNLKIWVATKNERESLIKFLQNEEQNIYGDDESSLVLDGVNYNLHYISAKVEDLRVNLQKKGLYNKLNLKEKFMLDLPIITWKMGWHYTSVFMLYYYFNHNKKYLQVNPNPDNLVDLLNSFPVYSRKYNEAITNIKNKRIYNTKYLENSVLNKILLAKCKSLSVGDTFNINLHKEFEIDDYINLFYIEDINIIKDYLDIPLRLDDFAGSWGSVGIKYYFTGTLNKTEEKSAEIIIDKMYFRLTDRFDFKDESTWFDQLTGCVFNPAQSLGNWTGNTFENNGNAADTKIGHILTNADFRKLNSQLNNIFHGYRPVTKYYKIGKLFNKITISFSNQHIYWNVE